MHLCREIPAFIENLGYLTRWQDEPMSMIERSVSCFLSPNYTYHNFSKSSSYKVTVGQDNATDHDKLLVVVLRWYREVCNLIQRHRWHTRRQHRLGIQYFAHLIYRSKHKSYHPMYIHRLINHPLLGTQGGDVVPAVCSKWCFVVFSCSLISGLGCCLVLLGRVITSGGGYRWSIQHRLAPRAAHDDGIRNNSLEYPKVLRKHCLLPISYQ